MNDNPVNEIVYVNKNNFKYNITRKSISDATWINIFKISYNATDICTDSSARNATCHIVDDVTEDSTRTVIRNSLKDICYE